MLVPVLFLGPKAGARSFVFPYERCPRTSLRVSIAEYGNRSLTVSDWVESYSAPNWKPRLNVMRPSEATAEDPEIISSSREAKVG